MDGVANMRRMLFVRTFLWAGLRKYHADMNPEAVEDLMDQIDVEEARKLILGLAQSTQPDARDWRPSRRQVLAKTLRRPRRRRPDRLARAIYLQGRVASG